MSKLVKKYADIGVVPGAKVDGLVAQSLITVYAPLNEGPEEIESVEESTEYDGLVIIKTKELSARETVITANGELPLKPEQRQYVMSGTEALRVIERVDMTKVKGIDSEEGKKLDMNISEEGIDTDYSTLPIELVKSLTPFINYVTANSAELDDVMDISSLTFEADGVKYPLETLKALAKIE